jgi:hypothetical protein
LFSFFLVYLNLYQTFLPLLAVRPFGLTWTYTMK